MLFPKEKMKYASSYQGKSSDEGWLVLDIGGLELDGVTRVYIDLHDVEVVKQKKGKAADALDKTKRLLGGDL